MAHHFLEFRVFVGSGLLAMTVPFCSAKLRISRAEEHLQTLNAEIDKFFAKNPGRYVSEPDFNRTQEIHKICFDERLPIEWRILATEIIEHLRASLDHATVATFFLKTGRLDSNYISFPFGKTADDLDNSIRGRSKDLVPEIKTFLRGFNAYKGGNDLLYSLNKLCNSSKHTLITFVVGSALELEMKSSGDLQQVNFVEECFWDSSKNEIIYARSPLSFQFQHQIKVRVYIALRDPVHSACLQHAPGFLGDLCSETKRVILAIEAECRESKFSNKPALAYLVPIAKAANGGGNGEVSPAAFWAKARELSPTRPWRTVARRLDLNEALCVDHYRTKSLPPGLDPGAIEMFLHLPVT